MAVVIGNQRYEHRDAYPAQFAINDASTFREYLVKTFGLKRGNIIFEADLSLAAFNAIFGTKDNPKGKLYRHVKPDKSDVYIYYSGHGAPDPDTKVGYFLPVDCDPSVVALNGYSLDTFYDNLKKLPARSVTVILDACFSGVSEGGQLLRGISPVFIEATQGAGLPNGTIFTSAEKDQVSTWYEEKKHSLFTYFFLSGLRGLADINKDGTITVGEMAEFLQDRADGVPYWAGRLKNREQTPTVFGNPNRVLTKY
ncbi:MAG: caspase domain-containing protein [Candidatus Zixiibacteriota bacterium]